MGQGQSRPAALSHPHRSTENESASNLAEPEGEIVHIHRQLDRRVKDNNPFTQMRRRMPQSLASMNRSLSSGQSKHPPNSSLLNDNVPSSSGEHAPPVEYDVSPSTGELVGSNEATPPLSPEQESREIAQEEDEFEGTLNAVAASSFLPSGNVYSDDGPGEGVQTDSVTPNLGVVDMGSSSKSGLSSADSTSNKLPSVFDVVLTDPDFESLVELSTPEDQPLALESDLREEQIIQASPEVDHVQPATSSLVEDYAVEDHAVEDHAVEDHAVEDYAVEDYAVEDHAVEDHAVENHAVENHSVEDYAVEDHAVEDHAVEDHAVEGLAVEDLAVESHAVEVQIEAVEAQPALPPEDSDYNIPIGISLSADELAQFDEPSHDFAQFSLENEMRRAGDMHSGEDNLFLGMGFGSPLQSEIVAESGSAGMNDQPEIDSEPQPTLTISEPASETMHPDRGELLDNLLRAAALGDQESEAAMLNTLLESNAEAFSTHQNQPSDVLQDSFETSGERMPDFVTDSESDERSGLMPEHPIASTESAVQTSDSASNPDTQIHHANIEQPVSGDQAHNQADEEPHAQPPRSRPMLILMERPAFQSRTTDGAEPLAPTQSGESSGQDLSGTSSPGDSQQNPPNLPQQRMRMIIFLEGPDGLPHVLRIEGPAIPGISVPASEAHPNQNGTEATATAGTGQPLPDGEQAPTGGNDYDQLLRLAEMIGPARPRHAHLSDVQAQLPIVHFSPSRLEEKEQEGTFTHADGDSAQLDEKEQLGGLLGETKEKCTVCLMDYDVGDEMRILKCHHGFHVDCIDQWLTSHVNSCPVCRAPGVEVTREPDPQPRPQMEPGNQGPPPAFIAALLRHILSRPPASQSSAHPPSDDPTATTNQAAGTTSNREPGSPNVTPEQTADVLSTASRTSTNTHRSNTREQPENPPSNADTEQNQQQRRHQALFQAAMLPLIASMILGGGNGPAPDRPAPSTPDRTDGRNNAPVSPPLTPPEMDRTNSIGSINGRPVFGPQRPPVPSLADLFLRMAGEIAAGLGSPPRTENGRDTEESDNDGTDNAAHGDAGGASFGVDFASREDAEDGAANDGDDEHEDDYADESENSEMDSDDEFIGTIDALGRLFELLGQMTDDENSDDENEGGDDDENEDGDVEGDEIDGAVINGDNDVVNN
ncbi:hypothetical protein HDU77_010775 [Chytriomyces hyalinus]|nr:hypothetical protein HDU77_010775 [Chytriomyces hyalinus]